MWATCQALAGLAIGYLIVSLCESFFHRRVGHASSSSRLLWHRSRTIGTCFKRAWYSHHVVHHLRTFRRDHVTQFAGPEEEARLRASLIAGDHGHVLRHDYGLRVGGPAEFIRHVGPTLPILLAACGVGGAWFTVGAALPLLAMPLASEFVHPYTHMSHERALREAPAMLRPLLATRYFRFIARHHWLHHRYLDCNFNLLPGGDFLLGVHRRPSARDLAEMAAVGLPVPSRPPPSN